MLVESVPITNYISKTLVAANTPRLPPFVNFLALGALQCCFWLNSRTQSIELIYHYYDPTPN